VVFASTGCATLDVDAIFTDVAILLALYATERLLEVFADVDQVIHYADAFCKEVVSCFWGGT
jgi:hypothetical protein